MLTLGYLGRPQPGLVVFNLPLYIVLFLLGQFTIMSQPIVFGLGYFGDLKFAVGYVINQAGTKLK